MKWLLPVAILTLYVVYGVYEVHGRPVDSRVHRSQVVGQGSAAVLMSDR